MKTAAARRAPTNVDVYITGFPRPVQIVLKKIRNTIRRALPDADESISYGIPTYKMYGRPVIYFAAFKRHYSIYPATAGLVAAFKEPLAPYEFNGKGTIRFPFEDPVPVGLIGRLAKFRADEVAVVDAARRSRRTARQRDAEPTGHPSRRATGD